MRPSLRTLWVAAGLAALVAAPSPARADGPARAKVKAKAKSQAGAEANGKAARRDYIDAMLREAWEEAGIKPSPRADDAEWLRRAYLDVLGRIPYVDESIRFLTNKDPNKRVKEVEYLLAHPDFSKNFATLWRILLIGRRGQGNGVDARGLEDWLRKRLTAERPRWDEIAHDLIAAKGSNRENWAVNYTLAHLEFNATPLTSYTTRIFLGEQIQCAQCHDHKFEDWKQSHYWGINAFFRGVRVEPIFEANETGAEREVGRKVSDMRPADPFIYFERPNAMRGSVPPTYLDGRKPTREQEANLREALARFITGPDGDQLPRAFVNRMWGHFFGRGFVNPIDDFRPGNPANLPELLDRLAADFRADDCDIKDLVRWIMTSEAYNATSAATKSNEKDEALFSHMALKPMTPEQLFESLLVATAAHKSGGSADTGRRRDQWLRQFDTTFATDEGSESTSFQGTIPQALMMMNGALMSEAVSDKPGTYLHEVIEQSMLRRRGSPEAFLIDRLYLAALCRPATTAEKRRAMEFFATYPDPRKSVADLFWALLNSNEFILNR